MKQRPTCGYRNDLHRLMSQQESWFKKKNMNTKTFLKLSSPYRKIARVEALLNNNSEIRITVERFSSPTPGTPEAFALINGEVIRKITKQQYAKIVKSTL